MKRIRVTLTSFVTTALIAGAASAMAPQVKGMDGGHYLPYKPAVVRETQQALEKKGLYSGKIDGRLDAATMHAIAAFQKQHGLQRSGVPTPHTRHALAIG
jgi:peptidoglycan hydrolase-like protein with peptidoglycan-binding domain